MKKTLIGFVIGLVLPVITAILFYKFGYGGTLPWGAFIKQMIFLQSAAMMLAVCCLSNLAVFSVLVNINKLELSRGVFLATVLYGLAIVVLKFVIQ